MLANIPYVEHWGLGPFCVENEELLGVLYFQTNH
jgi:hypothetical protein